MGPDWRPPADRCGRKPELPHFMSEAERRTLLRTVPVYLGDTAAIASNGSNERGTSGPGVVGLHPMRNADVHATSTIALPVGA